MEPSDRDLELGQFIPLQYHYNMLADVARTGAFEEAIRLVVPSGGRVLELGGGTGVLSFFAARQAARVWCVERNPELARTARDMLALNRVNDVVEVVEADAFAFMPSEPVDVVICEMLHVTTLVEKQVPVIISFKERYLEAFGPPLPRFAPEALVQAVQPVQQSFEYHGYVAPTVLFQDRTATQPRTTALGEPVVFQSLMYEGDIPTVIDWSGRVPVTAPGRVNALRFVTKNLLAILPAEGRSVEWVMNYLVVPLATEVAVEPGDTLEMSFAYTPGDRLRTLTPIARTV
jgi:protein arginine N-methyltransferase 1